MVIAITLFMLLWSAGLVGALPTATPAQPATAAASPAYQGGRFLFRRGLPRQHRSRSRVTGPAERAHDLDLRRRPLPCISGPFRLIVRSRSPATWRATTIPVPAHEDVAMPGLPHHATPGFRAGETTAWMNQDGVGCESCHGMPKNWLGPHTTDDWKSREFSPADKQKALDSPIQKTWCAGSSSAPAATWARTRHDGLTPRDVNHDLIAAGHPRLNFEFTAYQDNQPKHWESKPGAAEAAADFPARAWAVGQLVSARPRCNSWLLGPCTLRRRPGLPPALPDPGDANAPWPEFAEYGCFSCHHGLADEPWRRNRPAAGMSPGVPAWGSWHFPLTAALFANSGIGDRARVGEFVTALESLTAEMGRPKIDAARVRRLAETGVKSVDALIR